MVRVFRPQPNARSIIEPEPASLRLLLRNLQPLPPPDPLDAFDVHYPPGVSQHGCNPSIAAEWGKRYPAIGAAWRRAWDYVVPFFAFAPGIRKMIYTTNAVEALHRSLRKIIKTRGSFPNDDAALKLLYLAIKNAGMRWRRNVEWTSAMGQFAIQFGERFPGTAR